MSILLKSWMDLATTEQQERLAELSSISRGYLYQIASGKRLASAHAASRLEEAAEVMAQTETIPSLLPRYFIARSCNACPYARRCANLKKDGKEEL